MPGASPIATAEEVADGIGGGHRSRPVGSRCGMSSSRRRPRGDRRRTQQRGRWTRGAPRPGRLHLRHRSHGAHHARAGRRHPARGRIEPGAAAPTDTTRSGLSRSFHRRHHDRRPRRPRRDDRRGDPGLRRARGGPLPGPRRLAGITVHLGVQPVHRCGLQQPVGPAPVSGGLGPAGRDGRLRPSCPRGRSALRRSPTAAPADLPGPVRRRVTAAGAGALCGGDLSGLGRRGPPPRRRHPRGAARHGRGLHRSGRDDPARHRRDRPAGRRRRPGQRRPDRGRTERRTPPGRCRGLQRGPPHGVAELARGTADAACGPGRPARPLCPGVACGRQRPSRAHGPTPQRALRRSVGRILRRPAGQRSTDAGPVTPGDRAEHQRSFDRPGRLQHAVRPRAGAQPGRRHRLEQRAGCTPGPTAAFPRRRRVFGELAASLSPDEAKVVLDFLRRGQQILQDYADNADE